MCGIFAIIADRPRSVAELEPILSAGLDAIRHRGPDSDALWVSPDGRVAFAHARLAIIDVATGTQPMQSADGRFSIIYNGEIYNYLELREELGAPPFRTTSDTEVILRAYEKWGADCVTHLVGMFAFVLLDRERSEVFAARDRFGIKPLYWARTSVGLVIASEVKAIAQFLDRREVNTEALKEYFTFQFGLSGSCLLSGVSEFPPAHCATFASGGNIMPERYWEVQYTTDTGRSEEWFVVELRALLEDSIRLHLRSDVEVGAHLSGGVDSSLVAALARERRPNAPFRAFNGRFAEGADFDESSYARAAADAMAIDLEVTDITEEDFVAALPKVIWHLDQPVAGMGAVPQYLVSQAAARKVKVVLGGQGADEIFAGYARYLLAYFERCIEGAIDGTLHDGQFVVTYDSIIPNLVTLQQYKPMIRDFWSEGVFGGRDERYFRLIERSRNLGGIVVPELLDTATPYELFKKVFWGENVSDVSYFDLMSHFDFKALLPALLHVEDRMSMAHGLEARVPFLDHRLIEFAATVPAAIKFRGGELKRLLRLAFAGRLPAKVRERKDKMGFPVPLSLWLCRGGAARDYVGDLLGSSRAQSRFYLRDGLDVDALLAGEGPYARNVWALLSLELWQQQFIDAA